MPKSQLTPGAELGNTSALGVERTYAENATFLYEGLNERYGEVFAKEINEIVRFPAVGSDFAGSMINEARNVIRMYNPGDYDKSDTIKSFEKQEISRRVHFYFIRRLLNLSEEERNALDPDMLKIADETVRGYREKMAQVFEGFLGGRVGEFEEMALSEKFEDIGLPDSGFGVKTGRDLDNKAVYVSESCGFESSMSACEGSEPHQYFNLQLYKESYVGFDNAKFNKLRIFVRAGRDNSYFGTGSSRLNIAFDVEQNRYLDYSFEFDRDGKLLSVSAPDEVLDQASVDKSNREKWFSGNLYSRVEFAYLDEDHRDKLITMVSEDLGKIGVNVDAFLEGAKGKWADIFNGVLTLDETKAKIEAADLESAKPAELILKPEFIK